MISIIVDQIQCCEKSLSQFALAVIRRTTQSNIAFQEQLLISADEEAFLRRERCTEEFNQLEGVIGQYSTVLRLYLDNQEK